MLVQVLGMCSTMAITTSFFNGLGMGISVLVILTLSNVIIAAIRKIIPDKIRIAMFIVVIAGFVTCVDLLIQAFVPALSESLGVFIPLIVVNCIILGRAEAFSYKNGIGASFWDGIFQGFGYTVVLLIMCVIREFLGAGTMLGGLLEIGDDGAGLRPGHRRRHPGPAGAVPHGHADPARRRLPDPGVPDRRHAVGAEQIQG